MSSFFLFISLILAIAALADNTIINIGFLRDPDRDSLDWQAGMHAAIFEANEKGVAPGFNFSLFTSAIPPCVVDNCPARVASINQFLANITNLSVVMTPDWGITEEVVAATAPYKIPVLTPKTFIYTDTEHVINLAQPIHSDVPHMIRYMFGSHSCARSGMVMTPHIINEYSLELIDQLFTFGGYPVPKILVSNATAADLKYYFLEEDPDRLCFMMLVSYAEVMDIMRVLKDDPRFSPKKQKFFAFNTIEASKFEINGNTSIFDSLYIARHVPSIHSNVSAANVFLDSFARWTSSSAYVRDSATFLPADPVPVPSESAFFTYLSTRYFIELFKSASFKRANVPTPSEVLDVAYNRRVFIEGTVYQPLLRQCYDQPLAANGCFCNAACRITHTFKVNGSTGGLVQVVDGSFTGQAGYATTVLAADTCTPDFLNNGNYPIILSVIVSGDEGLGEFVSEAFNFLLAPLNNAEPRPPRPFRIVVTTSNNITNAVQEQVHRRVQPFITSLSMGDQVTKSSTLVVLPNANAQLLEEPPLRHYERNDENLLVTLPTAADTIHSLVAYYAQYATLYSGIVAYTSTAAEALLIKKSLNTFQIDIPVQLQADPLTWQNDIEALTSSGHPFVIVSACNNFALAEAVIAARHIKANGVVGISIFELDLGETSYSGIIGDVFFVSLLPDYTGLQETIYFALTIAFSYTVAQQATAASSTAATVLYQLKTLSVSGITFGPYSNDTCTDEQIRKNVRDRTCQCYKGPRIFYVLSLMNLNEHVPSNRTGGFSYQLTTCGVVYKPFIPTADAAVLSSAELGVTIAAASVFMILTIGAILIFVCCFHGKKNWYAPMDSAKPFAMVFTDIQNSTGLWARAPAAMSASVALHHSLIRTLIKKYKGYEVKTIGDSFMVAFKDVNNAALLALEIQTLFYNTEWPSEIDANYTEMIAEAATEDTKLTVALGVNEEQYKRLWNGVRVRVGVHYGFGNITKDPVSLGYDYYGTVVNTAARVEGVGHGGQVLLTDEAFQALEPNFVEKNSIQVIDLGPQPLRGLDDHIRLRQLMPMKFHERTFPPLRLDIEHVAADQSDPTGSDTTEEITAEQMASRIACMPGSKVDADTILTSYNLLTTGFSATTDQKWRKDTIKALGKSWNIDIKNTPNELMKGLMLIGVKIELAKNKAPRRPSKFSASTKASANNRSIAPSKNDLMFNQSDGVFNFSAPTSPAGVIARNQGLSDFDTPL